MNYIMLTADGFVRTNYIPPMPPETTSQKIPPIICLHLAICHCVCKSYRRIGISVLANCEVITKLLSACTMRPAALCTWTCSIVQSQPKVITLVICCQRLQLVCKQDCAIIVKAIYQGENGSISLAVRNKSLSNHRTNVKFGPQGN